MRCAELLSEITALLEAAGCDAPAFDARCLLEDIGEVGRGRLDAASATLLSDGQVAAVRQAAQKRATGYPLQYLLGEWDFLSLTLKVGEGVLIPRPDTELLCEAGAAFLQEQGFEAPAVLDLCAGSGCVGLGLCSLYPAAQVTAVELSEDALVYLKANVSRYPAYSVEVCRADVLRDDEGFTDKYDLILSNPPYIPASDIPELMQEVHHEPLMALDGGDGLVFYRKLAADWSRKLLPGGALMAEIGLGQAADVMALWQQAGFREVYALTDLAGIERVIVGKL